MLKGTIYNIQRLSIHDGPGIRTTVFLKGCPLECAWCSNPESQKISPQLLYFSDLCVGCSHCVDTCPQNIIKMEEGKSVHNRKECKTCGACADICQAKARAISGKLISVEEVIKEIKKDSLFYANSGGGVTFGGGEATMQKDFLLELMKAAYEESFHITLDTCGYCNEEDFKAFTPYADLFLFDCKVMDSHKHKELTGKTNEIILGNLKFLLENNKNVIIRIPLIPEVNDTRGNIIALADFLKKHSRNFEKISVEIMPYHEYGKSKYKALDLEYNSYQSYTPQKLEKTLDIFKEYNLNPTIVK